MDRTPCGAGRQLDVDVEPAGVGDGGDEPPQPIVRCQPRGRRPSAAPEEHQPVVRGMRDAVLDVAVEPPAQGIHRVCRRGGAILRQRVIEGCEGLVDHTVDQRVLVAEVMVDGRGRDAGAGAQLPDGEAVLAPTREQRLGGGQDGAPGRLGLELAGAGGRRSGGHAAAIAPLHSPVNGGIVPL